MNEGSKGKVDDPRIRQFLKARIAFLCSFMKAGSPHITPTLVGIKNGNMLVKTAIGRIKHKNV